MSMLTKNQTEMNGAIEGKIRGDLWFTFNPLVKFIHHRFLSPISYMLEYIFLNLCSHIFLGIISL